jgi:hypothetical protein
MKVIYRSQWPAERSTRLLYSPVEVKRSTNRPSDISPEATGDPRRALLGDWSISTAREKIDVPGPSGHIIKVTAQSAESSSPGPKNCAVAGAEKIAEPADSSCKTTDSRYEFFIGLHDTPDSMQYMFYS